jgi:hypothetical protein
MHRALIALFLLGTFAVAGCTEELTVPDLNNPSLEDLATNPTPAGVFTAAQGLMVGGRAQAGTRNGYTSVYLAPGDPGPRILQLRRVRPPLHHRDAGG